jgi:hypothetical protein
MEGNSAAPAMQIAYGIREAAGKDGSSLVTAGRLHTDLAPERRCSPFPPERIQLIKLLGGKLHDLPPSNRNVN